MRKSNSCCNCFNHKGITLCKTCKTLTNILSISLHYTFLFDKSIKQNVIFIYLFSSTIRIYQCCASTSNSIFCNHSFRGLSNKNKYFLYVRSINGSRYRGGCNVSGAGVVLSRHRVPHCCQPHYYILLGCFGCGLYYTSILELLLENCSTRGAHAHWFAFHRCDMLPLGLGLPLAIISFVGFLLNAYIVLVVVLSKQVS